MLRRLRIENGIKYKDTTIIFQSGLTAILGPNGCGKSLLVEFIAFALFGTVALRGKAADYPKDLKITLDVEIKDKPFKIERSLKDCQINNGLVVGTKPCNLFLINQLGYNYSVYKMGNYAEQVDILGLGKMKPAERKKAMDMVLGLSSLDKLVKMAKEKELKYKAEAEGVLMVLGPEPEKPTEPNDLDSFVLYRDEKERLGNLINQINSAKTIVDTIGNLTEPELVECPSDSVDLEGLRELQRQKILNQSYIIPTLGIGSIIKNLDQFAAAIPKWEAYQQYLKEFELYDTKGLTPEWDLNSLQQMEKHQQKWEKFNSGSIECPKCGNKFCLDMETIERPKVIYPSYYFREQEALIYKMDKLCALTPVEAVEAPRYTYSEIASLEKHNSAAIWLQEHPEDYSAEIEKQNLARVKYNNYLDQKGLYEKNREKKDLALEVIQGNDPIEVLMAKYFEYTQHIERLKDFERLFSSYKISKTKWDSNNSLYEKLVAQKELYGEACKNLSSMKTKIKTLVIPSLSKVAGKLLSEMSEGLYSDLKVTEDFEVTVDQKDIGLFSGSEQAMINLALRLAMGQVLTHKSLSLFIGDEIDASMRDERAQLTSECLQKVCKHIKQIVVISHRDIEADHAIDLLGEVNV